MQEPIKIEENGYSSTFHIIFKVYFQASQIWEFSTDEGYYSLHIKYIWDLDHHNVPIANALWPSGLNENKVKKNSLESASNTCSKCS